MQIYLKLRYIISKHSDRQKGVLNFKESLTSISCFVEFAKHFSVISSHFNAKRCIVTSFFSALFCTTCRLVFAGSLPFPPRVFSSFFLLEAALLIPCFPHCHCHQKCQLVKSCHADTKQSLNKQVHLTKITGNRHLSC